jgi:L-fuconolactonase
MTELPIVDAHVHLWEPRARGWYPALDRFAVQANAPVLLERHLLDDYQAAMPGPVAGLVHVSATTAPHAYLDEARWLEEEFADSPVPAVTIGTVDPGLDPSTLRAHLDQQAARERFRGIRVFGGLEPGSAAATEILGWLQERGLVFDLVADVETLPRWVRALEPFTDLTVVLEHLGSPSALDEASRVRWAQVMSETAGATGWSCKVSGLGMVLPEVTGDTVRPWLEVAGGTWGWSRLMFGSNMPMDAMSTTHRELVATMRGLVAEAAGPADARAFFHDNACRVYGLRAAS